MNRVLEAPHGRYLTVLRDDVTRHSFVGLTKSIRRVVPSTCSLHHVLAQELVRTSIQEIFAFGAGGTNLPTEPDQFQVFIEDGTAIYG